MFFRILIKYILGYINIKIEGYFVEKFINKCIKGKEYTLASFKGKYIFLECKKREEHYCIYKYWHKRF